MSKEEVLKDLKKTILNKSNITYYAQVGNKVLVDVFEYSIASNYKTYFQSGFRRYPDLKLYIPELSNHNNPYYNKKDFVQYELDILNKLIKSYQKR